MAPGHRHTRASERGQALLETAVVLPVILLVCVSIFEFGRVFQTWQVMTNAAREGARLAIIPNETAADVQDRVNLYLQAGQLTNTPVILVNQTAKMNIGGTDVSASVVTVNYPFSFAVLNPIARLVTKGSKLGAAPLTITASAQMRNESE